MREDCSFFFILVELLTITVLIFLFLIRIEFLITLMFFVLFQTEPFPHGICEFDRRCPVDIDCSSRIVDPLPYQWVKLGAGFNGSSK